ncbi:hypothetical protein PsAD2_02520 [Pseudovibrio axinellae]|uniref:Uncharacterized protein n=1 Tax=Pseudovibrio axinellae TaxID=989403 RepID=A0A165YN14_9HYPH|nr:hypothetical protein PsAD2_02520 [Pseudovibrio axinellae]SEP84375.1 hypothetical protein SAMN05421798_101521 [Pseudovibrio axinellae]
MFAEISAVAFSAASKRTQLVEIYFIVITILNIDIPPHLSLYIAITT